MKADETHLALLVQHHTTQACQVFKVALKERDLVARAARDGDGHVDDSYTLAGWRSRVHAAIATGVPLHIESERGDVVLGLSRDVSVRIVGWSDFEAEQAEAQKQHAEALRRAQLSGGMPGLPPGARLVVKPR